MTNQINDTLVELLEGNDGAEFLIDPEPPIAKCDGLFSQASFEQLARLGEQEDYERDQVGLVALQIASTIPTTPEWVEVHIGWLELAWHSLSEHHRRWSLCNGFLGVAFKARHRGDRSDNIESSIQFLNEALRHWTEQNASVPWARTHVNLAHAYTNRIQGRRLDNLQAAMFHCESALRVWTKDNHPSDWATVQLNYANAFFYRSDGNRGEHIEEAVNRYAAGLSVISRETEEFVWASLKMGLANALQARALDDRAGNIELAIQHYEESLLVFTEKAHPFEWARVQMNLGSAFRDRISGDPVANIELALELYQRALSVRTEDQYPNEWAFTKMNLGISMGMRIRGDHADNIEEGIVHFEDALRVFCEGVDAIDWARTHVNLGNSFISRIHGARWHNIERAIGHFCLALNVVDDRNAPHEWALIQMNLGNAYGLRLIGDPQTNLEVSIYHHERASKVWRKQGLAADWAKNELNLAISFENRLAGNVAKNERKAIKHLQAALPILKFTLPDEALSTHVRLGRILMRRGEHKRAIANWKEALRLRRKLILTRSSVEGRGAVTIRTIDLAFELTNLLLAKGRVGEAIETVEQSKAVALGEALLQDDVWFLRLPSEAREQITSARERLHIARASFAPTLNSRRLREAEHSIAGAQQELEETMKDAGLASLENLDADTVQRLAPDNGAMVMLSVGKRTGFAILVPGHGLSVKRRSPFFIPLVDANEASLLKLMEAFWIAQVLMASEKSWSALEHANSELKALLDYLSETVIGPISARLSEFGLPTGAELVLMPQGLLSIAPLHASRDWQGAPLIEKHTIRYASSANVLRTTQKRVTAMSPLQEVSMLGLFNPMQGTPHELPLASEIERPALARLFDGEAFSSLEGDEASIDHLIQLAPRYNYLHLACHGAFNSARPEQSGIQLAQNDKLTATDIIRDLQLEQCRLVILSACETGLADVQEQVDEYIGLASAFLQAGAAGVLATYWSVTDEMSARLTPDVMRRHLDGATPADALRESINQLRNKTIGGLSDFSNRLPHLEDPIRTKPTEDLDRIEIDAYPIFWAAYAHHGS